MIIDTIFNPQDSVSRREQPGIELIVDSIKTESKFDGDLDIIVTNIIIKCYNSKYNCYVELNQNELIKYNPNWQYEYCKREIESWPEWKKEMAKEMLK
jgi:hypothetical protein